MSRHSFNILIQHTSTAKTVSFKIRKSVENLNVTLNLIIEQTNWLRLVTRCQDKNEPSQMLKYLQIFFPQTTSLQWITKISMCSTRRVERGSTLFRNKIKIGVSDEERARPASSSTPTSRPSSPRRGGGWRTCAGTSWSTMITSTSLNNGCELL